MKIHLRFENYISNTMKIASTILELQKTVPSLLPLDRPDCPAPHDKQIGLEKLHPCAPKLVATDVTNSKNQDAFRNEKLHRA
jgi:hypothetical protein